MISPIIWSYGGGTNSKAVACRAVRLGQRPDAILFADTGGEKPSTYVDVVETSDWLESKGFPPITIVRIRKTLYQDCIDRKTLPSIAFGWRTCSQRWKIRPQDGWSKVWPKACEAWEVGVKVLRVVGFDADEPERAKPVTDEEQKRLYLNTYPLIDADMGRDECIEEIRKAGLPLPGKSACYFCPENTPDEIIELKEKYPDLLEKALAMEDAALENLKRRKTLMGLGMKYAWRDLIDGKISTEDAWRLAGRKRKLPCVCTT